MQRLMCGNAAQTDATLTLNGLNTQVSWITATGNNRTINYHVPTEDECSKCHQVSGKIAPMAPSLRNMNIDVNTGNAVMNQIEYFQGMGLIDNFDVATVSTIPDYNDPAVPVADRARAYLDMNCAHCHNPAGWSKPAKKGYDFRYETPLGSTRIPGKGNKIVSLISRGRMPYLGITVVDQEGLSLIQQYVNQL